MIQRTKPLNIKAFTDERPTWEEDSHHRSKIGGEDQKRRPTKIYYLPKEKISELAEK